MRVLLISFGTEEANVRLASGLVGKVDEVHLLLPEGSTEPHLHLLDPAVRFQGFARLRLRDVPGQLRAMARLRGAIRAIDPDVIHYQKGHFWFNLTLPSLARYPLVVSIHDPRHHLGDRSSQRTPQFIQDIGYRQADRVIAHNAAMKEEIVRELRIPAEKIDILPLIARGHGVPADVAAAEPREPEVLFHGRIWAYKGLEYFIRAQPLVNARVPGARFVIAGRGDDMARYRAMMADPERFEVHDEFVSFEKREALVARAAVVVLPYLEATQSGVIPVAYTHAKPVIATNVGGLPEQVDEGVTGFLVEPGDAEALAERIVRLLEDPALARRLGENGRAKQEREWSGSAVAAAAVPIYQRAIDAKRGATAGASLASRR